ncbi:MAG: HPP family protein [gamma proteobacterium endosymbiont of Lamellibrachia anaximandri]|nr:HPP family protein [gamma proteobacterium endosymbiont of Lamellibrachia anaximandri]MBL3616330.1 HPP family protein [gamma proteobacterium endosymbiont of Lamellibrachia anaximandri]
MFRHIVGLKRVMTEKEFVISVVGAFIGTLIATFFSNGILQAEAMPLILASTGASAILIFSLPFSPVSQPWNLVGGHLVSAFAGVSCYLLIPNDLLAASVSIPCAMLLMHLLRCMHPPGGATAITAVVGGANVHALGYAFIVIPVFINAIILLSIAMAIATFRDDNPFDTQAKGEGDESLDVLDE